MIARMKIRMEIKTYEIKTDKLKKEDPPLRLVMLSDLHNRLWGDGQCQLLEAVDRLRGDLILCAGDMLLGRESGGMEHTLTLFEGLADRGIPVITVNGNHESRMRQRTSVYHQQYRIYAERLKELGVQILQNSCCEQRHGSMRIHIHGYEMPLEYYQKFRVPPYDSQDLYQKLGKAENGIFHILLAHNPVYFKDYAKWGADLTLSGHLHGGIIRIPGIGGVITPQAKLFPKYDRGLFEEDGKYMVVSAGLGEHTVRIRICNPPQLIGILVKGTG